MKEFEVDKRNEKSKKKFQNNQDFKGELSDDEFMFGPREHLNMLHIS